MITKFESNDRRILKFPAVHPCEGISPATLLQSLITISREICNYQPRLFPTQRKNARETIRQISILAMFFEEIGSNISNMSDSSNSILLCLSELQFTFQKIQFLLADCTRDGAKLLILMKAHFVATQFRTLIRSVATALEVLTLNSMEISSEIKELIEMVSNQARKARMEIDPEDENAMRRVILVLNQFENKFEPDPFMIRKILGHLGIGTWAECHREVRFLDEAIRVEQADDDERQIPVLSSLLGLLNYCRGVLFQDYECDDPQSESESNSEGRSSFSEVLTSLNPEDFRCPISLELMTDPVTVSTGQTYDRTSIQKWLKCGNFVCPKTGAKLTSTLLVPNSSLKKLIEQFCAEYGVSLSKSRKKSQDTSRTILPGSPSYATAIKFLSEYLTLSLGYGTDRQKNKAAYEIRLLAKSNLFNRACLIESGAIPPLIELIGSPDPIVQENAIAALLKLAKQPRGQKSIIQNGGLSSVLAVLKHGKKPESRQIAAAAIFYLSSVHENRRKIGENSQTIPSLLELIKEGTPCGKKNAVVAVFALLLHHRNRQRALESGAMPILLHVLESSNRVELKTDTLAVIAALADSDDGSVEILQASALQLILRSFYSIETRAGKEYCVSILHSLCLNCGAEAVAVLVKDASLMTALYALLTDGTSHAGRKARSLIKILHKFGETRLSLGIKEGRQEHFVNVR